MFPGNNKLQLNQACMKEAVQMYLNSKFKEGEAPKVGHVEEKSGCSPKYFEISTVVEEKKEGEPATKAEVPG